MAFYYIFYFLANGLSARNSESKIYRIETNMEKCMEFMAFHHFTQFTLKKVPALWLCDIRNRNWEYTDLARVHEREATSLTTSPGTSTSYKSEKHELQVARNALALESTRPVIADHVNDQINSTHTCRLQAREAREKLPLWVWSEGHEGYCPRNTAASLCSSFQISD